MSQAASQLSSVTLAPIQGRRMAPARNGAGQSELGDRVSCFVAGPENQLLVAVVNRLLSQLAESVAKEPVDGQSPPEAHAPLPSPVVFSGPSGSGKTHLARGLVELWQAKQGVEHALYYTAADFGRELAAAIDGDQVRSFRRRLRRLKLLAIDDVHRLGASNLRAEELRNTIDAVNQNGGLVLVTVAGPLAEATGFDRPLLSRLAGGLSLEIAPPGLDARRELLRQATSAAGCALDHAALETLAEALPPEPPQVLRAALELRRRSGSRIDVRAAERLLEADRPANSPPLAHILRIVARYHKLPLRTLKGASRRQGVVAARAMAIYLARELTPLSYAQIGQLLGGRDHTTVMHNYRRIVRELPKDRALQSALDDLKRLVG